MSEQKRKTLHDWNRQITEEKERIVQERVQFEKELNDLSLIFLEAKDHYTTDSLQVNFCDQPNNVASLENNQSYVCVCAAMLYC